MNQAFPGTDDHRTVEDVDRHIKAANAELPPLPVKAFPDPRYGMSTYPGYTADQMREYARAALASAESGQGVQVPQDVAAKLTRAIERVVCSDCPYARGESAVCCMPDAQDALRWLAAPEAPAQADENGCVACVTCGQPAQAAQQGPCEAVAARYDFDGYGYQYIDEGSGSDWRTRHKDAELLYTRNPNPQRYTFWKGDGEVSMEPDPNGKWVKYEDLK